MRPGRAPTIGVFLAALAYFALTLRYGFSVADEGAVIEQIERLADGERLYTDFHIGYTPGFYYLHAMIMRVFGHSLIPIRAVLVIVNAASVAALFVFATIVTGRRWAGLAAGLVYLGSIPVVIGQFAMANTPYPVWYNTLFWLLGFIALLGYESAPSLRRAAVVGLLAGLGFAFKPNVGLFQIAASSLAILSATPLQSVNGRPCSALQRSVWWLWWLGVVGGVVLVFSAAARSREYWIFIAPAVVAALACAWRASVVPPREIKYPHVFVVGLAVVGAFLAVNLPWLGYYYVELGHTRFLERVLFFNAGLEQTYFVPHALVLGPLAVTVAMYFVLRILPAACERRGIKPDLLVAAAGVLSIPVIYALTVVRNIPEGLYQAVDQHYEAFAPGVSIALHWLGILAWANTIGTTNRHRGPSYLTGVAVLGALFLYLQVYPRADFAHWARANAMTAVLAATLLVGLVARWRGTNARTPYWLTAATIAAILVVAPALRSIEVVGATLKPALGLEPVAELKSPKAPLWMNVGRATWYADVNDVVAFLDSNTVEGEKVFYFPALGTIGFMADRRNPTRHGYFYPGWPGRDVEAEVIAALRRDPPRYVVVTQWHQLYFARAHMYYYALGAHLESAYRPYARFGRILVFQHVGETATNAGPVRPALTFEEAAPPELVAELERALEATDSSTRRQALARMADYRIRDKSTLLLDALGDEDAGVRDAAVWASRYSMNHDIACALLDGALNDRFSDRRVSLALRVASRGAQDDCMSDLLVLSSSFDPGAAAHGRRALINNMGRDSAETYWFGGYYGQPARAEIAAPTEREWEQITRVFTSSRRTSRIAKQFLIYRVAHSNDPRAVPLLEQTLKMTKDGSTRMQLLRELVRLGRGEEHVRSSLRLLAMNDLLAPRIALAALAQSEDADSKLATFVRYSSYPVRARVLWLAAVAGGEKTAEEVARSVTSPLLGERSAALWALGNIGTERHEELLRRGTLDAEPRAAEIATWALEALHARIP